MPSSVKSSWSVRESLSRWQPGSRGETYGEPYPCPSRAHLGMDEELRPGGAAGLSHPGGRGGGVRDSLRLHGADAPDRGPGPGKQVLVLVCRPSPPGYRDLLTPEGRRV